MVSNEEKKREKKNCTNINIALTTCIAFAAFGKQLA
jgi:hypothetical protein